MAASPPTPPPNQSAAASSLAVLLIVGVCAAQFWPVVSFWFTGIDALPLILSNRVQSASEIPKLFTREFLSAYEGQEIAGSVGVRPAGSALFALDYWLWGLEPFGYHLTDLLLHSLNAILVFLLARQLRPGKDLFVPLGAAILFAIHPLHSATVPLIPGRFDLLLCAFTLASLIALLRHLRSGRRADLVASLVLAGLAMSAKEAGIVTVGILGFTVVYSAMTSEARLRTTLIPLGLFLSVAAAFVIYRTWVLEGVGGYPLRPQDLTSRPVIFAQRFLTGLISPLLLTSAGWALALRKLLLGAFAVVKACFLAGAVFTLFRRAAFPLSWLERQMGPDAKLVGLLTAWEFAFFVGLGTADSLMGVFKPLYLYTPLAFWCIVLALLILHASRYLRRRWGHSFGRSGGDYVVVPAGMVLVILFGSLVATSPRLRNFDDWAAAGEMGEGYFASIERAAGLLPSGATVLLVNLPREIECGESGCVGRSFILESYAIDSWWKLSSSRPSTRFATLSALRVKATEKDLRAVHEYNAADRTITVRNTGGDMAPAWNPKNACVVADVEMGEEHPRRQLHIRLKVDPPATDKCYVFDPFTPEKLFVLEPEGLRAVEPPAPR